MSVVLSCCLILVTGFRVAPQTPTGVQCSSASTQTVRVAVRNCCKEVVSYIERVAQPGDNEFVQCRCAEKHAPVAKTLVEQHMQVFLCPDGATVTPLAPLPAAKADHIYLAVQPAALLTELFHPPTASARLRA